MLISACKQLPFLLCKTEALTLTYDDAPCALTLTKPNAPDTTLTYTEDSGTLFSMEPTFTRAE